MEKINFINNQAPALNATNLNQLQTNIENEFTDSNEFKNLYSNNYLSLLNLTYSNGTYTQVDSDTRTDLQWKLQAFNDSTFIKQLNSKTNNSLIRQSMNFTKDSSFNAINFGLNGTSNDTTLKIDVSNLENDKTYTLSWNLLNNVQGSIAWNEMQIEEGTSMTSYKNYAGVIVESGTNSNGSYIKYSDGTMICWNQETVKDQSINSAYGSLYQGTRYYDFPVPFANNVTGECTMFQYGTSASWGVTYSISNTQIALRGFDVFPRAEGENCRIGYIAIGKWK